MNVDGSGRKNLTRNPAPDGAPAWSPDGSKIAFSSERSGNAEVMAMNADGSGQTNLTRNPAPDHGPAWSPDGRRIAFERNAQIYVMNPDGSGQSNLTNNPAIESRGPAWSPDGTRIAFVRGFDIYVMNADGSDPTNVFGSPGLDLAPAWSPDGTRIAFAHGHDCGSSEIFLMDADGSGVIDLTHNHPFGTDSDPAWSFDGSRIASTHGGWDGGCFEGDLHSGGISLTNADGSGTRALRIDRSAANPAWSPDGSRIAFVTFFPCRVPNVVGRPLRVARAAIRRAHCSVGRIRYIRSTRVPSGRVIRHGKVAGKVYGPGARVNLVVSRGRR